MYCSKMSRIYISIAYVICIYTICTYNVHTKSCMICACTHVHTYSRLHICMLPVRRSDPWPGVADSFVWVSSRRCPVGCNWGVYFRVPGGFDLLWAEGFSLGWVEGGGFIERDRSCAVGEKRRIHTSKSRRKSQVCPACTQFFKRKKRDCILQCQS